MKTIRVKALSGTLCPREENPRTYINDTEAVDVPETAYYLRLLVDGSLVRVESKAKKGE